jgi:hypothetical protein
MKICPSCRKTYQDDNLNFCLEDGSVLTVTSNEPAPTVMMNQPRATDPSPGFGPPPTQPGIQSSFGNQGAYAPPKKTSKTWLWVVGILGVLLLLCGGGGVVGLLLLASQGDIAANNSGPSTSPTPGKGNTFPGTSPSPGSSPGTTSGNVESIDLNMFVKEFSVYGTTEMSGDELMMAAKQKDYYYVLVAPDDYNTMGATTRLTVRNPNNGDSRLGYGLIFHSDPQPLNKGYAFLIDSKKKRYRVVRHTATNESAVVAWKNSTAINDGASENTLEVRDKGDTLEFYINDQMVTTTKDQYDGTVGVPGLYSGDGVKIGFKKLEIRK